MSEYQGLKTSSIEEAKAKLDIADRDELCLLLLEISSLDNWEWVQAEYLKYMLNEDKWVASAAITGLGHLARVNKKIDKDLVLMSLKSLKKDREELEGKISDAISDIEMFVD